MGCEVISFAFVTSPGLRYRLRPHERAGLQLGVDLQVHGGEDGLAQRRAGDRAAVPAHQRDAVIAQRGGEVTALLHVHHQ